MVVRQPFDPRAPIDARATSVLAVLWLTGGLLTLVAQAVTPGATEQRLVGLGVGGVAVVVGLVLASSRRRTFGSVGYAALTVAGGAVIAVMVWSAGPGLRGATAALYVFVCVFSMIATRRYAAMVIGLSAAGHAAVLVDGARPDWFGEWVMVWGTGIVSGVLVAGVVASLRATVRERDDVVGRLRASDETKTAFLHAVHHELSRPMTVMSGFAETLVQRGDLLGPDQQRDLARRIAAQSQRMQGMLEDLLQLGSLDAGGVEVNLRAVSLASVAAMALELAGLDAARVELHVDDATVRVDDARVAHGAANLLTNAEKYGAGDEANVLRLQHRDGRVRVVVEDRGPGIPPDARERVFDPFTRARDEDRTRGTGVGLSVVRAVARLHGGDAFIEDRPGGGARIGFDVAAVPDGAT